MKLNSPLSTYFLLSLTSLTSLTLHAAVPLRWTVETSRVQPAVFDVVRGETIELEAAFTSYGKPVATTNQTAFLAWQTNGMESAWWVTNATTAAANRVRAVFTPEMDPGAATLTGFIGLSATNGQLPTSNYQLPSLSYRAAFTLRFRRGPGARVNTIEHPVPILDLAHTVVVNPPWPTQADFAATTTVMRAELKNYIDEEIGGAGLVTPQAVTNAAGTVTSNVVTKAYVEGLGIESGMQPDGYNEVTEDFMLYDQETSTGLFYFDSIDGWRSDVHIGYADKGIGDHYHEYASLFIDNDNDEVGTISINDSNHNNVIEPVASIPDCTNAATAVVAPVAASLSAKADATAVNSLQSQVSAIGAHLNAEDAHFVSTNYDSVVHMPEAYVEIKMSNSWITIWREMTRWNRFVGTNFNWNAWSGFHTFKTNATSRISELELHKADRAWGAYDSETGGWSPEGYTQISSSNIIISAGMAYQRTITTGGAVWVLQCNQGTAHIGGDTNGFFRIKDGDGVTQFEVIKGNKQEMGADATGITIDKDTTPQTITIPYSVESESHPTIQVCTDLALADWHAEGDASCAANVAWSGQSGAWVATVQPKSASCASMFVKATYMSGGETYIHNIAPVGMDSIILNGTKYYLGTATISGHTVLTLSITPPNN